MLQLSKIIPIFVPSFSIGRQHRGELLSFDPSENLENSSTRVRSLKAASPAAAYTLLSPLMESAHVYNCRCELIFILTCAGLPEPSDKECREGSHSLW